MSESLEEVKQSDPDSHSKDAKNVDYNDDDCAKGVDKLSLDSPKGKEKDGSGGLRFAKKDSPRSGGGYVGRFAKKTKPDDTESSRDNGKNGDKSGTGGSNAPQQPKGKRYERDRRGNWGRNERRTEKGGNTDRQSSQEDTSSGEGAGKDKKDRRDSGDENHRSDSRKDSKVLSRSKSDSGTSLSDSGKDSAKDNDKGSTSRNNKGDSREGKNRKGSGRDGWRSYSGGDKEGGKGKSSGDGPRDRDKDRDRDKERDRDRDRNKERDSKAANNNSGADLLNLLQKTDKNTKSGKGRSKEKELKDKLKSASALEAQWQKEEEEKRKKEEEEKRIEEEKIQAEVEAKRLEEERIREEEERKKREEEEAKRKQEEEIKMLEDYISETKERNEIKSDMRNANLHAAEHRPDESFFSKLDSSLKKNTAFVRKLKNLTELQKDSLAKDFNGLNLTKYIGEAAAAITEAKLKMSDIQCALHICSLMHQRYAEFATALLDSWNKMFPNKKDDKQNFNLSKFRVDLRFFAELIAIGVFTEKTGLLILANQLTFLTSNDKEEHNNLSIILSFCKHCGDDYAGLTPRRFRLLAEKYGMELPHSQFLPAERQKACRNLFKEYFSSLSRHLQKEHKELRNQEKQNRKILQTKGELTTERKERYEAQQQAYQKLVINATSFADIMDKDLPELVEEDLSGDPEAAALDIFNPGVEYQYEGDATLFEDEETRAFYENLPDLKSVIPGILYKDSENSAPAVEEPADTSLLEEDMEVLDIEDVEKELSMQAAEMEKEGGGEQEAATEDDQKTEEEKNKEEEELALANLDLLAPETEALIKYCKMFLKKDDSEVAGSTKVLLESFLQSLPNNVNREMIDKAAVEFCMKLNTKANRKKLVRGLFLVHRTRYDLLPFYSRFVATLYPCMPDVANDLVTCLKGDFRFHLRKKDQINIESKLKVVRFIGEMVKFKMFPKGEALHCLKMLLFDFSHHNIEMACSLLDTCGRFLYRSLESHHRTKVYLDVMMRKKAALHLDGRYSTMIENSFYYSNPPEVKHEARKQRPPMHEYIRKLLYKELSKITTEKVLRQMRKLAWDDQDIAMYAAKCMIQIWNIRYNSVHCAANLLAGLAPYHEQVAIQVVDGVLEDVRAGMEVNHPKFNQRRVSCAKYLGELYNYRMVESSVIFKTLYSLISFGVSLDESVISSLDPPEHLFRLRLVCVLLDTCGQYFDRGSSKKKLDCFLIYFQRYYWFKKKASVWSPERPFPVDVEYMVKDTLESLRPKLKLFESYEEAIVGTEELDQEYRAKLAEVLPVEETEDVDEDEEALPTIQETDEMDELSQGLSQVHVTDEHSTQDSELADGEQTGSLSQSQGNNAAQSRCRGKVYEDGEADEERQDLGDDEEEEDEEEDSNSDDDLMESAGEDEEDDSVTILSGGMKHFKCQEDDDFMTAFDKMMAHDLQARHSDTVKVPQVDIAVPMHLKGQKKNIIRHGLMTWPIETTEQKSSQETGLSQEDTEEEEGHINFVLMTKRGNKQQFTTLNVPITAEFATKFKEREEAERMEKERMKRVVLDIHERQEEEDYQEMLAGLARPIPVSNMNRERRVKYQHPKGAPDADLIFGSK